MKKSMLLSFVTAGAIIATSVGTYATWDQTSITSDAKALTINAPVSMTITPGEFSTTKTELSDNVPVYTSETSVIVKDVPDDITGYTVKASAKAYKDAAATQEATDVDVHATPDTPADINGEHKINVTVTPKEGNTGGTYYVKVTANLTKNADAS